MNILEGSISFLLIKLAIFTGTHRAVAQGIAALAQTPRELTRRCLRSTIHLVAVIKLATHHQQ
jgi:hypothetical protein